MSLENEIKELNSNIKGLIKILEVYPSPVDNIVEADSTQVDKAVEASKAEPETPEPDKPKYTHDDLAEMARKAIQANKTENRQKVKDKMEELGASKITATPEQHIDTMYAFLESLV